jgi:haloalkane dehalogenase
MRDLPALNFDINEYKDLYPFESHYLEIDGLKYHYLDEGGGDDVLLMLHGNPTWSFYFRNLVLALKEHFRIIVPDHMGCGLSDKPQRYEYTLDQHISNLEKLLEKINPSSISYLVHDWGGMIGFGSALKRVEKVKKLIALNTCAFRLPDVNSFSRRIGVCRIPGFGKIAVQAFNAFAKGASVFCTVTEKMSEREKKGLLAPYNNYRNRIATHQFVLDIPLSPAHRSYQTLLNIEENLHKFANHPLKVIWGMQDFCFDRHFLREWKRFFPNADVHQIRDAGHYVIEDARDEVIQQVKSFLIEADNESA